MKPTRFLLACILMAAVAAPLASEAATSHTGVLKRIGSAPSVEAVRKLIQGARL